MSGQNLIWNVQNDQQVNGATLPTTPRARSLAGVGNFLGNGLKDLIWHNSRTGQNLIWNLQGDSFVNGATLPTTPSGWNVAGIGAFGSNGLGHHEDRTPTHDNAESREATMAAFAKSWRWE